MTDKTFIGKWGERNVYLRTEEDADAIEMIKSLMRITELQKNAILLLREDNEELADVVEDKPQIILN